MKKTMKKSVLLAGAALLSVPAVAAASGGIQGACVDCHTMHNSFQGASVAVKGLNDTATLTPIQNLLKYDCIACHAQDANGTKTAVLAGGSTVPQVYHSDGTGDLAGGNFKHIADGTSRKGHNVIDLFAGGDNNGGAYGAPPGKYRDSTHGPYFSKSTAFDQFTCAGTVGCHGTRSQLLTGSTNANGTATITTDDYYEGVGRRGIAAVSGAHHANQDGAKNPAQNTAAAHDGANQTAASYRFINGLKGYENEVSRWQNVDSTDHNEYYGEAGANLAATCSTCHVEGTASLGGSARKTLNSTLAVPQQDMTGFCVTCHGVFHSPGTGTALGTGDNADLGGSNGTGGNANGVSGAFLRHPSDYVMPTTGEYAAYATYDISAPVARNLVATMADSSVSGANGDMVMCLSCHKAHASEHDSMLRFDYNALTTAMNAGEFTDIASAQAAGGCLACHTTKGVLPANR